MQNPTKSEPDGRDKRPAADAPKPPAQPPKPGRPAFDHGDAEPGKPVRRNG